MKGEKIMKVLRKREVEVKKARIGDQITIQLVEFGEFTATVQKITDRGPLFMFDDYVASRPMNAKPTNKGGFEKSDLNKWMSDVLLPAFPEAMQGKIENLTIPTYGQMFGHDDWYNDVMEPDDDEQFPLMVKRMNRVADFNNNYKWGWLQNATKKKEGTSYFAIVSTYGAAYYASASNSLGVRPVFLLVD